MENHSKGMLAQKSYDFAIKIILLSKKLNAEKEYVLSKQILRSGTSVGAMVREAKFAQSNADYIHKFSIALKEANETDYWLNLLHETQYISAETFKETAGLCNEIISMLISTVNTLKNK
ncbi:MAG: four helix bundle protein [Flavobacteriia bacterium]|nr:four helix bundle protein [Flavobacteriia bacterium]MBH2023719.1 four helix bundle protein [Flavobacteriales bacterium]